MRITAENTNFTNRFIEHFFIENDVRFDKTNYETVENYYGQGEVILACVMVNDDDYSTHYLKDENHTPMANQLTYKILRMPKLCDPKYVLDIIHAFVKKQIGL